MASKTQRNKPNTPSSPPTAKSEAPTLDPQDATHVPTSTVVYAISPAKGANNTDSTPKSMGSQGNGDDRTQTSVTQASTEWKAVIKPGLKKPPPSSGMQVKVITVQQDDDDSNKKMPAVSTPDKQDAT